MNASNLKPQISNLHIGTAGWNYREWVGNFYPTGTKAEAMFAYYATRFDTVELDTTFYGIPRPTTVAGWRERATPGFTFAAKFPRLITHDKKLHDAAMETAEFLTTMAGLGDKMGPFVLQFPYSFKPSDDNLAALTAYLANLPATSVGDGLRYRYAVEVRHKGWLTDTLYDLLRAHNVALVLTSLDQPWMPQYMDTVTADFSYIRWLGNIEGPIQPDDHIVADRSADLQRWAEITRDILKGGREVWGYFNNHWAGYSPGSAEQFLALIREGHANQ